MTKTCDGDSRLASETGSAFDRVVTWWHETRDRWRRLAELRNLPAGDLDRMAHDSGMTASDFRELAAMPQGIPQLLRQRLAVLRLTPDEIERISPLLVADLARTCCNCGDKRSCSADLAADPENPAWRTYCPNAGTLETLR